MGEQTLTETRADPGSFRDPYSTVFYADGGVYRALSEEGRRDWEALAATTFFRRLVGEGKIVGTEPANGVVTAPEGAAVVLRHEAVPFVSYPYEWPFGMLKASALLQLELLQAALAEGMILKDSTPYNVQWRGAQPVFIDVGSFERLPEGEPWIGYRQFCMLFLYPLLLQAWKGVPFQPWLRGSIDGIEPRHLRSLLSLRDRLRRGAFTHVVMHARLDRRAQARTVRDVKGELRAAGFKKELIVANVRGLDRLVRRLHAPKEQTVWTEYHASAQYTDEDAAQKAEFVRTAAASRRWRLVWDLGCNDGRYSRIAAENAEYVVAIDADAAVADGLYAALSVERNSMILPLTMNLTDPSPGLGWRGSERRDLAERGVPELTLALALIHHVSIAGNVPVREFVRWLRSLQTSLVIEFPTRADPLVQRLLAAKRAGLHADYERGWFERCLEESFDVERTQELASGTRTLYFARPKI